MPKINQEEYELLKSLSDYWKWIARDKNGRLYKFQEKPKKVNSFQWNDRNQTWLGMSGDQFQFIQWEDSEPYNIAELIEEYEYSTEHVSHVVNERVKALGKAWSESEETEVKKDLDWAKKEIKKIRALTFDAYEAAVIANNKHFQMKNSEQLALINKVLELINQLDEPEVLSSDWIDEHAKAVTYDGIPDQTEIVYVDDLQNLLVPKQEGITEEQAWEVIHGKYGDETLQNNIDYVESQGYVVIEKPTTPPEVDELIRRGKGRGETLTNTVGLMKNAGWNRSPYADGAEWAVNNLSDFVIAWEHGYEVEEEQKYYVRDKHGVYLLAKNHRADGQVETVAEIVEYYGVEEVELDYELTEQEIKDYDERYWPFAVKVEELEE